MAEVGRWNGHTFTVSPDLIRGFTGLTIKGSSETEDKTSDKQKYVSRKNSKPAEVTIKVTLNQMLGCDVREEAIAFVRDAMEGQSDYFYIGSKKLIECKLMLVDAQVKDIFIPSGDNWLKADVQLTMKQCDKYGGISSEGDGKKKKRKKKKKKSGGSGGSNKNLPHFADHNELLKLTNRQSVNEAANQVKNAKAQADRNVLKARATRQQKYQKPTRGYMTR